MPLGPTKRKPLYTTNRTDRMKAQNNAPILAGRYPIKEEMLARVITTATEPTKGTTGSVCSSVRSLVLHSEDKSRSVLREHPPAAGDRTERSSEEQRQQKQYRDHTPGTRPRQVGQTRAEQLNP